MSTEHAAGGDLAHSLDLLWGAGSRGARGPKPGLSLERIVRTAVELANGEGLPALSMRRVAGELGVGTMSLYRYVPNKGVLVDLMVDHVSSPGEDAERLAGLGWRDALEFIALSSWRLYTGNPWLLQVNQARPLIGPGSVRALEAALGPLEGLGLSGRQKMGILSTINHYVQGVARTQVLAGQAAEQSGVTDEEFWSAQLPYVERAMADGSYPLLAALDEDSFAMSLEETLRFGLRPLLDGFEAMIGEAGGAEG
ncbi:TetR/AcrR family transcriptional regulator [Streptomyces sp. ODS28]|uniref:TetR/AcrR family transcriptional regulator n=1 Tax=Streptomyces sp. ODS28 TaxID=3136688 RepID=UPI0031ED5E83